MQMSGRFQYTTDTPANWKSAEISSDFSGTN